ncbi:MAG TPA: diiron oxygenase [Candidatus Sulfotelmatobacter sp.]|nr:diiron oxygenase [Candidatus Sulfotelmatobacter sp.]
MTDLTQTAIAEPNLSSATIDFSRPFMPEELTPLFFTPACASLSEAQRLRYNQLDALYFNEQTMFFEKSLARNVLGYFLTRTPRPAGRSALPGSLKDGLRQFLSEEEQHTNMFRGLNRQCAPAFYAENDFYFIRVPPVAAGILDAISKRPLWFPFLLWLMHLQEEKAMFFGKMFLKNADSLEPHFVSVQRKHLADEIGHVRWDEALLDWVWPKTGGFLRRFNVHIFSWMLSEYFTTPKRTAPRILSELAGEFPELKPRYPEICRQLRALGRDNAFRRSLYCPDNASMTFKRFDAWPEFRSLAGAMPGYVPGKIQ